MASGTIAGTTSNVRIDSKIVWNSVVNVVENYSELSLFLYFRRNNTGYTTEGTGTFTLTVGDQTNKVEEKHLKIQEEWVLAHSATFIVPHEEDGTKQITVGASGSLPPSSLTSVNCSKTITLDKIERAAVIKSVSDPVNIGEGCIINWTPLKNTHSYKVVLSLGNWSEDHNSQGESLLPITFFAFVPYEVAEEIKNAPEAEMTVTLKTFDENENLLGEDSKVVTAIVPYKEEFIPTLTYSYEPVNEGLSSAFSGLFIQGFSRIKCNLKAEGKYGATIEETILNAWPKRYFNELTSDLIFISGNVDVSVGCVDSRGFSSISPSTFLNFLPYSPPKILPASNYNEIVCERCDSNGNLIDSGIYLKVIAGRAYSLLMSEDIQRNFCQIQYRYKLATATAFSGWITILDGASIETDEVNIIIPGVVTDTYSAYTVEIRAIDDIGQSAAPAVFSIPSEEIQSHEIPNGFSFGEKAEEYVFSVAKTWTTKLKGECYLRDKPLNDAVSVNGTNYRKWGIGRCEIWGTQIVTLTSSPSKSGDFYKTHSFTITLPVSVTDAVCVINIAEPEVFPTDIVISGNSISFALLSIPAVIINQQFTVKYQAFGSISE